MLRTRHLALLLALALALPSAAFAQGAGDDQYQDPFGDEPTAQADQDDGLSEEPPTGGGSGGSGGSGDSGGSGGGGAGETGGGSTTPPPATSSPSNALPNTGADPRPLAVIGVAFVLMGVGLRLRTIDPDAF